MFSCTNTLLNDFKTVEVVLSRYQAKYQQLHPDMHKDMEVVDIQVHACMAVLHSQFAELLQTISTDRKRCHTEITKTHTQSIPFLACYNNMFVDFFGTGTQSFRISPTSRDFLLC